MLPAWSVFNKNGKWAHTDWGWVVAKVWESSVGPWVGERTPGAPADGRRGHHAGTYSLPCPRRVPGPSAHWISQAP